MASVSSPPAFEPLSIITVGLPKMLTAKAYNTAIRILGQREHSEVELRAKVVRKVRELPPQALDEVVAELKQLDLLSDRRFAETLIRSRISRGYGPYYIRQELGQKGINAELAAQLMDEAGVDWLDQAITLVQRRHPEAAEDLKMWSKAARFLQRRGFSAEVVTKALGPRPSEFRQTAD